MNQQQDTMLFKKYKKNWNDISSIIKDFNDKLQRSRIQIEAIEMISPTEGLIKFKSQRECEHAIKFLKGLKDSVEYEMTYSYHIIDYSMEIDQSHFFVTLYERLLAFE